MIGRMALVLILSLIAACGVSSTGAISGEKATGGVVRLDGAGPLPGASSADFSDRIDVEGARGVYSKNRDGKVTRIVFELDPTRVDPARGHLFAPVGETASGVVVLIDDYATNVRAAHVAPRARQCEDGTETFVRVFSLPRARQLAAIPAGSCIDGVARPKQEATWLPPDRFRVEIRPARTFAIRDADIVTPVGAE